jgi:hypothetical protein
MKMDDKAISKTQTKTTTTVHEIEHTDSELYKVGMYTTAAFAAVVGAWGLICLSSAVLKNGGPVELLRNLFQSITGV